MLATPSLVFTWALLGLEASRLCVLQVDPGHYGTIFKGHTGGEDKTLPDLSGISVSYMAMTYVSLTPLEKSVDVDRGDGRD